MNCEKCGSAKVRPYKYGDVNCYECHNCGHDSCDEISDVPEERSSQREKGKFSPYKSGGSKRTSK